MRILHTSDWHLGRSFHRVGLLNAQATFLDHLIDVVRSEKVDLVLVAGDIYDRALPGIDVVALLDDVLARLAATGATVVLSSGNHDSPQRLGFASRLIESSRVFIRTDPARSSEPIMLADRHGEVAVYALPYLEPAVVAEQFGCARTHAAVLQCVMDRVRTDLAGRSPGTRSVAMAHAFVVGGTAGDTADPSAGSWVDWVSDSERDISVGGVACAPLTAFAGVDYLALGHLHRSRQLAETVRYSGSPLAYSFSEAGQLKSSWLIDLGPSGVQRIESMPTPVPRPLALLRGPLAELLSDPELAPAEQAWCQVTLTDPQRPAEAMRRIRSRFAETVELRFAPAGASAEPGLSYSAQVAGRDDIGICCGFLDHVRGRVASGEERHLLTRSLEHARRGDPEEHGAAARRMERRGSDHDAARLTEPDGASGWEVAG